MLSFRTDSQNYYPSRAAVGAERQSCNIAAIRRAVLGEQARAEKIAGILGDTVLHGADPLLGRQCGDERGLPNDDRIEMVG